VTSTNYVKITVIFIFLFAALAGLYIYSTNKGKSPEVITPEVYSLEVPQEIPTQVSEKFQNGLKVGDVTVTMADLEKEFKLMYEYTPENIGDINNWTKAIDQLNDKAIIQNEGLKEGLFTEANLNPRKVNEAREFVETKGKTFVSGEFFSIWFLNTTEPAIGVEAAKALVLDKMQSLRSRVLSGELTMKQAGDEIRNDKSLSSVDLAYESNAYRKFENVAPTEPIFTDTAVDQLMWTLDVDEVSEIITANDFGGEGPYAAYYVVIKLDSANTSEYNSVEDLLRIRKKEGLIININ